MPTLNNWIDTVSSSSSDLEPSKALDQILKRCRRLRIRTVADVDDLIFVPKYSAVSPSVLNNQATELSVRSHFKRTLLTMQRFDEIITATEPLAHYWTKQTGRSQVKVIPNGLSTRWLQTSVRRSNRLTDPFRTITYLPGSNSHDKDFSEIVEVLAETLHSHKDTNLRIVGTLKVDERMFPANRLLQITLGRLLQSASDNCQQYRYIGTIGRLPVQPLQVPYQIHRIRGIRHSCHMLAQS